MASLDVDDANILSAIFRDAFPDNWNEDPHFAEYLSELSSFGVDKLAREPDRLAEERAQVLEQTQDLAFQNYKTFIQTAECSKEIFQDFQIIEEHVCDLLEKLPKFSSECSDFLQIAEDINISRRMNSQTLQRHTQLLEILEMPQLMDTCVRNGYYEEALELAAHVKRLEKKHSSIPVIQNIVEEVKSSTQLMLTQLIQQLRTNIQLPACLRVIGYLRRLDVFNEAELRIKFLQARDSWFQNVLKGISAEDAYHHITKSVEASRVHLFDIITQYRAIFSDDDTFFSARDDSINEAAIFHGWILEKVSQFLATLESDLDRGIGNRLDSILGQCMYFGLSFSRVGADFRGLLPPIFQRAALKEFDAALKNANSKFDEAMQSYSLLSSPGLTTTTHSNLTHSMQLSPPLVLLDYQPLAAYCNNILTSFNDLRLCVPISVAGNVAEKLQASLAHVIRVILGFHRAEESVFDQRERSAFGQFCHVLARELIPYLNKCLQTLFPPAQIAQIFGLPLIELVRLGNIGIVDVASILAPIEHLIPERDEAPPVADDPETDDTTQPPSGSETVLSNTEISADSTADAGSEEEPLTMLIDKKESHGESPAVELSGTRIDDRIEPASSMNTEISQSETQNIHQVESLASQPPTVISDTQENVDNISQNVDSIHVHSSQNLEVKASELPTTEETDTNLLASDNDDLDIDIAPLKLPD
ncbi:conserved oligomeric Golgi complex subunit 8-like isoform X1 [Tubulanus polymorphus]|uniref:conserved oligomeric Golgi complex subunit 8-like isoform X1 n=1 Tax=Tubulanus polymorphus TaxID=672921 RepID=UPI003DA2EF03